MTPVELEIHLRRLGMEPRVVEEVLHMARESPSREVGNGALDNLIVYFFSKKNDAVRVLESHTVERVCALELELDQNVLAYYAQVACTRIERNGGSHVSSGTVDFMVILRNGVKLIECKGFTAIPGLLARKPEDWRESGGQVRWLPYEEWAKKRGLEFEVWVSPQLVAPYLANLQLMYSTTAAPDGTTEGYIHSKAVRLVAHCPISIEDTTARIPRFTPELAAHLVGSGRLFGAVKQVLFKDQSDFILYADKDQARHFELELLGKSHEATSACNDLICRASLTDISKAKQRLALVDELLNNNIPIPKHRIKIVRRVIDARSNSESDLAVCLTSYSRSGNRNPRLDEYQLNALEEVIRTHWNSGLAHDFGELHGSLVERCREDGVTPPSKTTLARHVKKQSRKLRDLATGGIRKFQSNKPASDPRLRSIPPQARHLVLKIDSTKLDNRSKPDEERPLLLDTPLIYQGIDGCTGEPMAHCFVFGPARTDGVAILLRHYVTRHGRLPHEIHVDRGTENRSKWLKAFCQRYGIHLVIMPTGGSRSNSGVENLHGHLNSQLSHRLAGSTLPDQAGRSVDGRYKSYRTAKHNFSVVRDLVEEMLYEHLPRVPDAKGTTPKDAGAESTELFPTVGRFVRIDEEFLFATSVPVRSKTFDPKKGIRTQGQTYLSQELVAKLRTGSIEEVRYDPCDPALIRVRLTNGIVRAWSSLTLTFAHKGEADKVFHRLISAQWRGEDREVKEQLRHDRYRLTAKANATVDTPANTPPQDLIVTDTPGQTGEIAELSSLAMAFEEIPDLTEVD